MSIKLVVCDIYKGSKFYNAGKNIVRVSVKFDTTDVDYKVYDVPLMSTGTFKNPDFRYHKVLVFFHEETYKKIAIQDPENTEIGEDDIKSLLGILIDSSQYHKLMGSIGNTSINTDSDVGSQDIEDLDFFIPAGYKKTNILDEPDEEDLEDELRVCGIAGGKDGSIIIRSPAGEIVLGTEGIRITGKISFSEASSGKADLVKENNTLMEIIPKTIVTPFPNRLPNIEKAINLAGIVSQSASLIGKFF